MSERRWRKTMLPKRLRKGMLLAIWLKLAKLSQLRCDVLSMAARGWLTA
jgi:hypothetical protein